MADRDEAPLSIATNAVSRRSTTVSMSGNRLSTDTIPKSVLLACWKEISQLKHSNIFLNAVSEEDVPGYHEAVLE